MNRLHIEINDGRKAFSPGETLAGTVRWELDDPPQERRQGIHDRSFGNVQAP